MYPHIYTNTYILMERGRETELRPCPASKDVKDELLAHTYIDSAVYV